MRFRNLSKVLSAAVVTAIMCSGIPTGFRAEAAQQAPSLNISKIEVSHDSIGEDRIVSVDVRIDDNDAGFLAAGFGIVYDDRLVLEDVVRNNAPGNVFEYAENADGHIAWFSGASGDASGTACTGRQTLFTLQFLLPENYAVGDVFYISYSWESAARNASYWYTDKETNQIDWIQTHSIGGSIRIPDPDAPRLSYSEVQMNQRETAAIGLLNYEGVGIWYTEHPEIAYFEDPTIGEITAVSPGTCTAYCLAGTTLLMCDVTVTSEYYYNITSAYTISLTDPTQEVYITYPNPEGSVIWLSTRPDLLTVSNTGKVTGLKNGTCQIIGTSNGVSFARQVVIDFPVEDSTEEITDEPTTEPFTGETVNGTNGATDELNIEYGDVDENGRVNLVDVVVLNKHLMVGIPLTENGRLAADVVKDNNLNAVDSLAILKYCVGLLPSLPV